MRKRIMLLSICLTAVLCTMAKGIDGRQLFDFGWTFTHNGKTVSVDLPHDWDIYAGPNSGKGSTGTGGGWFEGGKGEYRKTFATPDGELVKLHFEGVYQKAEVFVNGHKAGQHAYGYTPFTIDITPYLKKSQSSNLKSQSSNLKPQSSNLKSQSSNLKSKTSNLNEIVVKVDNSEQPNCRWYSGSGIYRHVWLETMPAIHIYDSGIVVRTREASKRQATVDLSVLIENEDNQPRQFDDIEVTFRGGNFTLTPQSKEMKQRCLEKHSLINPHQHLKDFILTYTIEEPHLWSPDDPYLYEVTLRLKEKGKITDEQTVKFGIRTFSFDAEKGFVLNGKPTLINGACVHHDDGVLGAMAFDAAEIRKVMLMKEAGFNLIRTSHNPTTRAFLDACDSLGMMVIDEAFDGWRQAKTPYDYSTLIDSCYREDIRGMVVRDINHPSVICWSIGNEVMERKDIRVITTARQMKKAILEIDNTRPVTEALCSWDSDWEIYDPHAEVLDVVGYNYMIHKHEGDHMRDPKRVMWQTESYPRDAFKNWAVVQDNPYIVGDIVWTGLDYLGESGIGRYYYDGETRGEHYVEGGIPEWHGAYCGDVDITGWRKPISHYREMLWSDKQDLYMAVREPNGYHGNIKETAWSVWPMWESWTWKGWEGKPIEVEVYTKQPEVKLYLNDQLIGTKQVSRNTQFKAVFTIPYQAGTLRAETVSGSANPLRQSVTLSTAGEPTRLRLTADRRMIAADGQDLAFITIEVIDSKGNICPEAVIPCEVSISGRGQLIAAASADLKDTEPYTSTHVKTWKGRAILVVRSTQKSGQAKVSVKSSLPTATINITQK